MVAAALLAPPGTIFPPILMRLRLLAACRGDFVALGRFAAEARLARLAAAALPARRSGAVRRVRAMAVVKIGGRM